MNEKVNVTINNKVYQYSKGKTLLEISKNFSSEFKFPILLAYIDNNLMELNNTVNEDCSIKFIDCLDRIGNRIYQKGLFFVLMYAINLLYGYKEKIKIRQSIDKAVSVETYFELTPEKLIDIKNKMQEIINNKMPIEKCYVKKSESIDYFLSINDEDKANTLKYNTNTFLNLYKLGEVYNYFYCDMPINTEVFTAFDLHFFDNRHLLLQFPVISLNGSIPDFVNHDNINNIYTEYEEYLERINVSSSSDLNKIVSEGEIEGLIRMDEVIANANLLNISKKIFDSKDKIKIILLGGPSCSGKTTTSRKLSMYLRIFGFNPRYLSIDDYFKARKETPKDEYGEYNFESLDALKIDEFNDHLTRLLKYEEVSVPTYNFITGLPEYNDKRLKLEEKDLLIIEGLHAINDELTKDIPQSAKFKIYISELTNLNIDNQNVISTTDVRLLRRIVRDARTRGYKAEETLKSWDSVRRGEEKYIFPYQNTADMIYDTALVYEIGVLKLFAEPLLYDVDASSPYYEEAKRLLNFLRMFLAIPTDVIPPDSILKEFIGKSFFE